MSSIRLTMQAKVCLINKGAMSFMLWFLLCENPLEQKLRQETYNNFDLGWMMTSKSLEGPRHTLIMCHTVSFVCHCMSFPIQNVKI